MKKIFLVLSVTLLSLAGCTKFVEETIPADVAKKSGEASQVAVPSIESVTVAEEGFDTDYEFKVKVTPGEGNNYYSFAIVKGAISGVDAETLLTQGYTKSCVTVKIVIDELETEVPLCGSFKASAQNDTTVHAFKLTPNTEYTVYAVANNSKGTLSEIASLKVKTTDKVKPSAYDSVNKKWTYDASDLEDGTFVVKFDDPIVFTDALKEGTAKFYATYLSANQTHKDDGYTEFDQIFVAPIPVDSLSVSGKEVSIQVPERIPGAAVLITFDAGVVKNGVGLENEENTYGGYYWNNDKPKEYGLAARFKTATWKFSLPMIADENTGELVRMPADTVIYFQDAGKLPLTLVAQNLAEPIWQVDDEGEPISYNYIADYLAPTIIYTDSKLRQVAYPAEDKYYGELSDSLFVAFLSEEPDYGSSVALSVEAESVEDLWGNPCEAFSTITEDEDKNVTYGNYFYSYGFKMKDLYGTYTFNASSQYAGPQYEDQVIIAPCDEDDYEEGDTPDPGDVKILNLFKSITCLDDIQVFQNQNSTFYGRFNIHNGILVLNYTAIGVGMDSTGSYFVDEPWGPNYVLALSLDTADNSFSFSQKVAGTLELQDVVAIYLNGWGTWDRYRSGTLTKISDDYTIPSDDEGLEAGVAAKKAMKNTPKNFVIKR